MIEIFFLGYFFIFLSSGIEQMVGDTDQRTLESLPADQQKIAPKGGLMRRPGKEPAVQENINQTRLQSSNKVQLRSNRLSQITDFI